MEHTFWIWYPGDFELYHAMKQNFSRVERGFGWPAFGRVRASATVWLSAGLMNWSRRPVLLYFPMRLVMCL